MTEAIEPNHAPRPRRVPPRLPRAVALAAALVAAAAAGAGATAVASRGHRVELMALPPQPVSALRDGAASAIKGNVVEIFGNKFVVDDGSGRALVETGRRGEGAALVASGENVTVQGRFEHGFLHAMAITHPDGRADMLDPPAPPPRGGPDEMRPGRDGRPGI